MPVWEDSPVAPSLRIVPAMSLAVELDWLLSAANRPEWRAGHPTVETVYAANPGLGPELRALWGPDEAISCGGFAELEVLANRAGLLGSAELAELLDGMDQAGTTVPTDPEQLPLTSETAEDRRAIVARLALLRRSKARRRHYLDTVRAAWEAARPDWEANGRPAVEQALSSLHRAVARGEGWQALTASGCHTDKLGHILSAHRPHAEVVVAPAYYTHKGLFLDLPGRALVGVGTEYSAATARARTEALSRQLKTMSDPTRLAILDALHRRPHTVGELADAFSLAQPTVSNHVKALRQAGLLTDVRQGRRRYLQLQGGALNELLNQLQDTFGTAGSTEQQEAAGVAADGLVPQA